MKEFKDTIQKYLQDGHIRLLMVLLLSAARQAAIKRLTEEQYRSLKKRPAKKKVDESVQQISHINHRNNYMGYFHIHP